VDFNPDIDWREVLEHMIRLGSALLLALPMGLNREQTASGGGLRTFPLVAIAACAYMLVGMQVYDSGEAEARVMYGIITGIGFIGGGAILKNNDHIIGTATAASIWNTGAIGVAVAYHRYEIAIVLSLTNYVILKYAAPFKYQSSD